MEKTWPSRSCASTFTSLSLSPKPISSNTDQNHLHLSPKPKKITSSNHSRSKSRFSSTSSSSSSIRDFSALPFDVLTMIAANFSHPSLQTASLVCRAWRDALKPLREAMLFLRWGKRFKHGRGVKQNTEKALESFLKGAARGSTLAMVDAGLVYWEMGKKEEAIQLYRRAAELADSAGQCNLGISYLRAEPPNPKEAVKWLKQASVSGHIRAQYQLALCLHQGHGVEQNLQEAARWYLKAAEGGYVRAMYNTSLCYSMGEGLVLNHRLARKWMKRAADRGHCKAQFEHGLGLFSTFRMGLWSIWISGILLIAFSFYATQKLPSSIKDQIKNTQLIFPHDRSDFGTPKITIFTAPSRPFSGSVGARQVQAIRSWIGLSPNITVVLFTKDPSVVSFAGEFGSRVSVEPDIDFTFLGTPFFHSMVARSLASLSDISVIIDPETILLPDFILTLSYAHKLDHDWLLVSSSRHVSYFLFHLDEDGKHWLGEDGKQIRTKKLQGFLSQAWQWKHCEERMLLAWNNGYVPLHNGVLPPFLFGKELHNHWVVNEALSSDYRFVFDASWSISNFYLNPLEHGSSPSFGGSNVTNSGNRSWESVGNLHLGSVYGALSFREANYSNMVKFCMCNRQYLFVNPAETTVYPFGHRDSLSLRKEKILGSRSGKKVVDCVNGFKSLDVTRDCYVKDQLKPSISLSLPLTLETLLSGLSDKNKTIVLAVAGYSYKDMLMNWVCRLKRLLISNFVVCALDRETYEFAVLQGLPVFKDSLAPTNISFNDCHFGTQCFQRVTKVKSRLVLQILKLGYNVLMSDVDVYWFKNPLPFLYSFGPSVLVAQSDEYNVTGPINVPRRLNSGFYFARNDGSTVAALEKVVKHAATSNLSEQPSFYDTLCGEGGSNRVGHDQCFEPETNLTVHFLDRDLFPNGAYKGLWEKNPKASCEKECFVLHNNWISGRRKKLERQVSSGLWEYDINSRMCVQNWQKAKFSSYF